MSETPSYSRPYRLIAQVLVAAQVLFSVPVAAQEVDKRQAPPPPKNDRPAPASRAAAPTPKVTVNRTVPKVEPVPAMPQFSPRPTDLEIMRARVFEEPLVPVGGSTSVAENKALAKALLDYLGGGGADATGPLEAFLKANPTTVWRVALLTDLGIVYRRTGYFSRALASWEEAWTLGKGFDEPNAQAITDRALGELADLNSRLGRADTLEALLAEAKTRDVRGSASEKVVSAADGLWRMKNRPEVSFRCGPHALASIWQSLADTKIDETIWNYPSTSKGTSLAEMDRLGNGAGMKLQMAKRAPGADVLFPAMVHWKAGHFAAIVKREGERYLVQDPTFGNEIWVREATLNEEASGYALVREGPLPTGWEHVADAEGSGVWGKGTTANNDLNDQQPCDIKTTCCKGGPGGGSPGRGGPGSGGGGGTAAGSAKAMAEYSIHLMLVNLHLTDTPLRYEPPRGPSVRFAVHYNQREVFQPQIFYYSNLGPKWTFDWISYIQDDPSNPSADAFLYSRGGGAENYTGYSSSNQSYALHLKSRALVVRTSSSPVRYERRLSDGSVEVFGQADGSLAYPRKVFMTQSIDPQGNALTFTYDASLRLVAVTDAIGQVTTLSYQLPSDPLKITKVTDPFGRYALFDYNASGRLSRITDIIGIQSEFDYGAGDFIQALTTPYGTSTFASTDDGRTRWVEATDPLGGKERVEFRDYAPTLVAGSDPAATVPTGFSAGNISLSYRNTFYWDKKAMALYPGDYTKARLIHWLHATNQTLVSGVKESEKAPLENRVWYNYAGQVWTNVMGTSTQPAQMARVLDDGTSQIFRYEYNARGLRTKEIDPLGRETAYVYGNNNVPDADPTTGAGIDLLQVKRKNAGGTYDVLSSYSYNTQHLPLTITDALGKVTTYTYNAQGQVLTVTTPKAQGQSQGATTTFTYDTNGYLMQVSGPVSGANTTLTYDAYGRRRTVTDPAGLVVTFDYDTLDRVTKVTYPDTTYEQTTYNRLDAEERRDRLGRMTKTFYDSLSRVVATRDAAGQTTQYQYAGSGCTSCGAGGDELMALIDANGNATTWSYDAQGRVTQETRANGSHENYVYEATTSRLKQKIDRKNVTTTFTYFLDGKLRQKAYSDTTPLVSYTYSTVTGLMLTAANGTDTLTWTYDPQDRVATEASTKNASTVGYSYDDAGNRTLLTLNGATHVSYAYDQQSRLTGITRGSNTIGFGYDTPSRRTSMTYPNGVATTYGYDTESRLTSIAANKGATPITSFAYILDAAGNRTRKTTLDFAEDYRYDDVYRLVSADRSTGTPSRFRFAYDPAGNRTADQTNDASMGATFNNLSQLQTRQPGGVLAFKGSTNEPASVTVAAKPAQTTSTNTFSAQAPVGSGTTDVAVAATDPAGNVRTNTYRVSQSAATTTYTYDSNGNLNTKTEGTDTWAYEWNARNELTRVTKNSVEQARFSYDPLGRRVEKVAGGVTTSYTYDDARILRQISGSGSLNYVHGPNLDEPLGVDDSGALSYLHADALGSIVRRTNAAGAVTLTRQYDAWGNLELGASEPGYAFTAREWDAEVSLYYYRARYYDPKLGRFTSEDPISIDGGHNLFAYARNAPVRFRDPYGLRPKDGGCIFYSIVVCSGCRCTKYWVPSERCPDDDFHRTSEPEDVSPKYWQCDDSHFQGPGAPPPNDTQISPRPKPGNGPKEFPGDVQKIEKPPDISVTPIK